MIERRTTGLFGNALVELAPENDEDVAELQEAVAQGRIDNRQSFRDLIPSSVHREQAPDSLSKHALQNALAILGALQGSSGVGVLDDTSEEKAQGTAANIPPEEYEIILPDLPEEADEGALEIDAHQPFVAQPLTPREGEILALLAQGKSNRIIASELQLRENSVKNYVAVILRKMRARDRKEAIASGLRQGLIEFER